MWKLQPAVVPFDLTNEEENRYERRDKFGNVWHGRKEDLGGRKVSDAIDAEWGSRKRCQVKRPGRTYVYCRCSDGCPMVVQYGSENGKLVREAKNEHQHAADVRADIRNIASQPERAGAALVEWSIAPARVEDKIPEVLAYVQSIKDRQATEPWHCRVLEVDDSAGIFCFTTDFYVSLLMEHWETLMEHGLRVACDGTHAISNSGIKLIAVGWLAQHVPRDTVETTFVLLAFALSPSENHVAVRMLLESVDAHVREHGVKKLTQSSWWASTKRWVSKSAFMRNDHVFDRYWDHCFQLLEDAGESDFVAYLQTEHFQKDAGVWTAAWRAAVLDPGYGSYSLNAVDSFWKLLDHYVPEEKTLPLRQVMERYEHTGRVFQNDGKWSALCVAPSTLVTPSLVGEASTKLSPRLNWKEDKQVGRMSCRTLERLLAQEAPLMLQFNTGQENATQVFCKYGPSDFNAVEMEALSDLVRSTCSAQVDAAFQRIGALDENGFHPRRVSATYEKFTALYEEEGAVDPEKGPRQMGLQQVAAQGGFSGDTTPPATPPEVTAPATPPQVAARLAIMIAEGRLPRTTAEQRRRNHRTSGNTYGVPEGLTEALEAGYIHPNLPPPQGMVWNLIAHKTFALQAPSECETSLNVFSELPCCAKKNQECDLIRSPSGDSGGIVYFGSAYFAQCSSFLTVARFANDKYKGVKDPAGWFQKEDTADARLKPSTFFITGGSYDVYRRSL
ncbi:unnamed protein product [Symbiodinium sp. CCMP2592]|nr:unnamed protein product [Symbiodinium sp. CCMP2592]